MHKSRPYRRGWRDVLIPFTLLFLFAALISLVFSAPALADPSGRIGRVAWLSETGGLALDNRARGESFRPPVNQPLTSGDVLSTDGDARAEIQIGSTTLRLDAGTSLELTRIDDERITVFLRNGRSIVKLASPETVSEFDLNTPNGRITARTTGVFRIDADNNGSSASAYFGTLHFAASDADFDVRAGERADVWFAGQTRYRLTIPASDDFMHWSAARDQRPAAGNSARYVSPEMTGADDLDAYGDWSDTPEYGAIWTPRAVAAGWAPYRTGHWVWVAPWGWNWVGHEPWGFAPFHYGRWVQYRGRWGWVPGERIARPVYAPALVTWSSAPGFSVALSFGRAPTSGWYPLAPREVYVPVYRSSPDYVRRVNRTHVARIENPGVVIGNPRDAGRPPHHADRDLPRAEPPRPFVLDKPEPRAWQPVERPREFRRDDRRRDDGHRDAHDNRDEPRLPPAPQAKPQAPAQPQHPDMALFPPSQQAKPPTGAAQREPRENAQRAPNNMERRADMPRRTSMDDDPRKRQRPDGGERR
ncbi:MAG: FecR domain-containing protein [Propionivibrio sp.]